jgi:hypothetical protein
VASRWLLVAALVVALGGCRHLPGRERAVRECPGEIAPAAEIAGDFLLRQQVRVFAGDRVFAFQLVAQKRGDELILLGLHGLGAELFSVRQTGPQLEVDALPPPTLEVPPLNLLRDFHAIRREGPAPPGVEILHHPPSDAPGATARSEIRRPACGYRAEFATLSEEPLP